MAQLRDHYNCRLAERRATSSKPIGATAWLLLGCVFTLLFSGKRGIQIQSNPEMGAVGKPSEYQVLIVAQMCLGSPRPPSRPSGGPYFETNLRNIITQYYLHTADFTCPVHVHPQHHFFLGRGCTCSGLCYCRLVSFAG